MSPHYTKHNCYEVIIIASVYEWANNVFLWCKCESLKLKLQDSSLYLNVILLQKALFNALIGF